MVAPRKGVFSWRWKLCEDGCPNPSELVKEFSQNSPQSSGKPRTTYEFGPFRLDPAEHLLLDQGEPVALTRKAFETLLVLVENCGHLVTKDDLIQRLWPDSFVEEGSLTQNISIVRKSLGVAPDGGQYIETVPKLGYRFVVEVRRLPDADSQESLPEAVPPSLGDASPGVTSPFAARRT